MEYKGIDVSSNNKKPDWKKVKASGIQMAVLRITQLYGLDSSFEHNYEGCKQNGIKVGVYRLSYAKNVIDAKKEADDVIATLAGRKLDLPVFYDIEWEEQRKLPKETIGLIIKTFWSVITTAGYKFGIYSNTDWYDNVIPADCHKYDFWLAAYPNTDTGVIVERLRPSFGIGWQYSSKGKVDGISTNVDMDVFYTDWSNNNKKEEDKPMGVTAQDAISVAQSWLGRKESDGTHKMIIDLYNSYTPRARGYKVQYNDQWCDTCVSAIFIKLNAVDIIGGTECGVEEHVKKFKAAGIWIEDGKIAPLPGDIIVFNWDDSTQPNDGYSDHIGIVEKVANGSITTIEGNYKDSVSRRTIPVGWGYIRGYARPKYSKAESPVNPSKPTEELSDGSTATKPGTAGATIVINNGALSKTQKWVGKVTASTLNVRTWAGVEYPTIKSYPKLNKDNLVAVCDSVIAKNGIIWYYVKIADKYYGFVCSTYIKRV